MSLQSYNSVQKVEFAHALRGLAAIIVLAAHFLGVFWSAPSAVGGLLNVEALEVTMPSYFAPLHFSTMINYGSFGVALFFLISGFVIPFSLRNLSRRAFLVARFFRIYPVYIVSIAISVSIIYGMGELISDKPFPYEQKHVIAQGLLLRGWLWLPSIDGLSWTLEIELVFYIIAAAMAPLIVNSKSAGRNLIIYALLIPVVCIISIENIDKTSGIFQTALLYGTYALPFTIYMFSGTLFYLFMNNIISSAALALGCLVLFVSFSISLSVHPSLKTLATSSYLIALLVFTVFFFTRSGFRSNYILDKLANISYPLYAVHAILGYSVMYVLAIKNLAPWIVAGTGFLVTIAMASILHYMIEKPTMKFGKNLGRKLFPKSG